MAAPDVRGKVSHLLKGGLEHWDAPRNGPRVGHVWPRPPKPPAHQAADRGTPPPAPGQVNKIGKDQNCPIVVSWHPQACCLCWRRLSHATLPHLHRVQRSGSSCGRERGDSTSGHTQGWRQEGTFDWSRCSHVVVPRSALNASLPLCAPLMRWPTVCFWYWGSTAASTQRGERRLRST